MTQEHDLHHPIRQVVLSQTLSSNRLLNLPGAELEVQQIGRLFSDSTVLIGDEATKDRLLEAGPRSEIVHVAAHTEIDEIDPLYSTMHLAKTPVDSGILEAHEIYQLDLSRTSIVTLSACETGLGHIGKGDEQWGFTRTFLAAGASSLLVSLWPVSDEATQKLMIRFYEAFGSNSSAQAMRRAQLALIREEKLADPVFWASFNLVGEP